MIKRVIAMIAPVKTSWKLNLGLRSLLAMSQDHGLQFESCMSLR